MSSTADLPAAVRERLARLSPERRALLERQLGIASSGERAIPRRADPSRAPLTSGQEFLWRLDQVIPDLVAYNVPRLLSVSGPLDVDALQRALDLVVARHEILRTTFHEAADGPWQRIGPARQVPIEVIDVALSDDGGAVADAVRSHARHRFNLSDDLLLRATVIRRSPTDHLLLLLTHHIASDEASRDLLFRECAVAYRAFRRGEPVELPDLPIQYGDYAAWRRERSGASSGSDDMRWWSEALRGLPRLALPLDRPPSGLPDFAGARRRRRMPEGLLDRLRAFANGHDASLFMVLLAGFEVMLTRFCGQVDFGVGVPATARRREELDGLIGYFPSLLVLRASLVGTPGFAEVVRRVRATSLAAFEHPDFSLEELDTGEGEENTSGYQVFFALQNPDAQPLDLDGARTTVLPTDLGSAKLDLALGFSEDAGSLAATIEYRTSLFDAATIDGMLLALEAILDGAVADPDRPIDRLPLVDAAEGHRILTTWGTGEAVPSAVSLVQDGFAAQARRTPDAVAIEYEGRSMTFAGLESSSNRLAHRLRGLGACPGSAIGVCLERSPELIVALLGVLKSGAHYVPLATDYPPERLAFMREDAGVGIVLSGEGATPEAGNATVVALEHGLASLATWPDEPMGSGATPESPAYLIYTSGSTGRPKGVLVPHRAVINFIEWMARVFPHDGADAILQKAPISFDASVWELYLPLFTGARMVLARAGGSNDPGYLTDLIRHRGVTTLQFVPSQLDVLLDVGGLDDCGRLRRLFCGGEALPPELLQRAASALPQVAITNLYGPTETTVYSSYWEFDRNRPAAGAPIGRPIQNTVLHVLDPSGSPVAAGMPGELHIGGKGVALGYHRRPELTAERFVADRVVAGSGTFYRTGDRVRWRADGVLEYLGRIDSQVKLRGHRIELGEIESSLRQLPGISAAAVVIREDVPGDRRLVAYIVPVDAAPEADLVRAGLRDRLPEIMVPEVVLVIDRLPLNSNGKLDRAALPAPSRSPGRAAPLVAPRTTAERDVAALWQEILGLEQVGVTDGFVELGGHSLSAMRLLGLLRRRHGVLIPLTELLRGATVAELATRVEAYRAAGDVALDDGPALTAVPRAQYRRPSPPGRQG